MEYIHFTNSGDKNTLNWLTEKGIAMKQSQNLWVGALWQAAMPVENEQQSAAKQSSQAQVGVIDSSAKQLHNNPA